MLNDDDRDARGIHPDDTEPFEYCDGCPLCDEFAAGFIVNLERDLRAISLELWVAGWTPSELIAEIRRATGDTRAVDLLAHVLIVDDSHRSEHARPESWTSEIQRLRARTGIDDDAAGWIARWIARQPSPDPAAACLQRLARALGELVDPHAVAATGSGSKRSSLNSRPRASSSPKSRPHGREK